MASIVTRVFSTTLLLASLLVGGAPLSAFAEESEDPDAQAPLVRLPTMKGQRVFTHRDVDGNVYWQPHYSGEECVMDQNYPGEWIGRRGKNGTAWRYRDAPGLQVWCLFEDRGVEIAQIGYPGWLAIEQPETAEGETPLQLTSLPCEVAPEHNHVVPMTKSGKFAIYPDSEGGNPSWYCLIPREVYNHLLGREPWPKETPADDTP